MTLATQSITYAAEEAFNAALDGGPVIRRVDTPEYVDCPQGGGEDYVPPPEEPGAVG